MEDKFILNNLNIKTINSSFDDFARTDLSQLSLKLIDWAGQRSDVINSIYHNTHSLPWGHFHHFAIEGSWNNSQIKVAGYGRSKLEYEAAAKAINEVLERIFFQFFFSCSNKKLSIFQIYANDNDCRIIPSTEKQIKYPGRGFWTSNGWSAHFNLNNSIENSFREVMERHILLYTFLKYGWKGFYLKEGEIINGVSLDYLISKVSWGGYRAGIVASKIKKYPGRCFGYICDREKNFVESTRWEHAFFESYEVAIHFEKYKLSEQWLKDHNAQLLDEYQWRYMKDNFPEKNMFADNDVVLENKNLITTNLVAFNISDLFQIPIPLFACFCWGQDLIPFALKQDLNSEELIHLQSILNYHGITNDFPEFHPII